jgi:hypothetical protein
MEASNSRGMLTTIRATRRSTSEDEAVASLPRTPVTNDELDFVVGNAVLGNGRFTQIDPTEVVPLEKRTSIIQNPVE